MTEARFSNETGSKTGRSAHRKVGYVVVYKLLLCYSLNAR